eukprot:1138596-Pelagomonas_calceolata.AAC.2
MRDKDITRRKRSFTELKELGKARGQGLQAQLKSDLLVLKHIWFSKAQGDDHASRLENLYGPQAKACKQGAPPERSLPSRECIRQAGTPASRYFGQPLPGPIAGPVPISNS